MRAFQTFRRHLEHQAAAWLQTRGLSAQVGRPYCLPRHEDWPHNMLVPGVSDEVLRQQRVRQAAGRGFPLHKYLHHGLSSQAMLFNLIVPLLLRNDLAAIAPAFVAAGVPWPEGTLRAELEHEDRSVFHEQQAQATSLDLAIWGDEGAPLYVEAKLVETGFGACSLVAGGECDGANPADALDACALHRRGRTYWTDLAALGFDLRSGPICPMALYYQFFREAGLSLKKGGHFILLVHGRNPSFFSDAGQRGQWPLLMRWVPPALRGRFHRITVEQCAEAIAKTGRHDDWIHEFQQRYALLPPPDAPSEPVTQLRRLPAGIADQIRAIWQHEVIGAGQDNPARGRSGQRRISRLLVQNGVPHGGADWQCIIAYGRMLYALPSSAVRSVSGEAKDEEGFSGGAR